MCHMIERVLRDSLQVRKGFPSAHSASLVPSLCGQFDDVAVLLPAPVLVWTWALEGDNTTRSSSRRCLDGMGMSELSFLLCPAGKHCPRRRLSPPSAKYLAKPQVFLGLSSVMDLDPVTLH